ncbi:polyketide synthase [Longimicrobium sp.]|uniref:type I polyketide synthase n=1 Tax=Longimicrobium sp. TaxID=2029185 RepID=UPI002E35BDFC|nr:polyketide synthase [Longimicrobium sp.]HEX6038828.1 beta-ketoacyl synthase N-terminal-like domain-containing protein [Longimicrobium sp.]
MSGQLDEMGTGAIAIIGMAGRFPGARDVEAFWSNLRDGVSSITFFSDDELRAEGVDPRRLADPSFVKAAARVADADRFDSAFFGFSPREADVLDPQHRVFLETAWEALENAGCDPAGETVGVYAGSPSNDYVQHVLARPDLVQALGTFQVGLANGRDYLATHAAHRMNLRGPAVNVHTACSTSLVAVHVACQALANGECDVALAGGAAIKPGIPGYYHTPGGLASPDGHVRAFSADAGGLVGGEGVGIVVLKRLADALADGDAIRAVIRGSAINNDGAQKVGFTAPSVEGQAAVIEEALGVADVDPSSIGYVEGHGSGTALGDPVEVAALTQAFGPTERAQYCALGSVKTNVGHLDAAAGAAGLIKATLAVERGEIPPSLNFSAPNPEIDFASSPFFVNTELRPWPGADAGAAPRRAGVSSFGIGGTNAHVVLEQAPAPRPSKPVRPWQLLTLSARTPAALETATDRLAAHLRAHPEQPLHDVAWTLQTGRRGWEHRRAVVARTAEEAAEALEVRAPDRVSGGTAPEGGSRVAFLFPGLGSHYPGMGQGLYASEPVFRETVDRCAEILRPHLGLDLREVLYPADAGPEQGGAAPVIDLRAMLGRAEATGDDPGAGLNATRVAQPALFVTEYALARMWMSWGIQPAAMVGHSLGEYVAATVAGVWSLEDALLLAAERARIVSELPPGGMMGVTLPPSEVQEFLKGGLDIGALNGPSITVFSGPVEELEAVQAQMEARGVSWRRLPLEHAFHSRMMEPVAERVAELLRSVRLHAPTLPFASSVTGRWITAAQATDPAYWSRHLVSTVRFGEGVETLASAGIRVLLETGPGHGLRMLASQLDVWGDTPPVVVASMRHAYEHQPDAAHVMGAAGRLWAAGAPVDWRAVHAHERLNRVPLPTYPFERRRHWIERPAAGWSPSAAASTGGLYLPTWRRAPLAPATRAEPTRWLLLADESGVGLRLAARLRAQGHTVAVAEAGDAFRRVGEGAYTVRPGAAEDLASLRDALEAADGRPGHVVLLWGVGAEGADDLQGAQARGYASVAALAAVFAAGADDPLRVTVVTDGVQDVGGGEPVSPVRATVLGACAALRREHPAVVCRVVDVRPRPGGEARLADQLLAEVTADVDDTEAALRGPARWVRGWEPAPAPVSADDADGIRPGGAYLFTGAPTTMGWSLAEHLQATRGARVAILADPALPEREAWDAYLATTSPYAPVAHTIGWLRGAEARGVSPLLLRAPMDDADALRAALERARTELGALHGIVHAPALGAAAEYAPLAQGAPEGAGAELARLDRELATLRAAADGLELDFVLLQSSIVAGSGSGMGAAAAGYALVDAWAARAAADGAPWTSIGWDRWRTEAEGDGGDGIPAADGLRAFAWVAALGGEPRVVASMRHPGARAARPAAADDDESADLHPRPSLADAYHAPSTPLEEQLSLLWRDLFGIRKIGVHDDFFQLGGHSLLGMQLVSRVRGTFGIELPLAAVFDAPTISQFAAVLDQALVAEVEAMSDEEVALALAASEADGTGAHPSLAMAAADEGALAGDAGIARAE